jgi:hypothetical protein
MNDEEKKRLDAERQRILAHREKMANKNDPMVRIRFQNIEDPGTPDRPSPPLNFTYEGYVFRESRDSEREDTALRHGKEYDLPLSVVEHLNGLMIPDYGTERDPVTKALKTVVVAPRHRFSCVPVDMGKFTEIQATPPPTRRGRPPKENEQGV